MIQQVSVFMENTSGRINALFQELSRLEIDVHAFTLADTTDFGIARLICDTPQHACKMLSEAGFRASVTDTVAVYVDDRPGGLANLLQVVDKSHIDIQYAYCFSAAIEGSGRAIDVMRASDAAALEKVCHDAGFVTVNAKEIYEID